MTDETRDGVAIMGATATGKSELAIRIAELFGGEIVSMDSRQVYRGMDIGTGKVSAADRARAPHHLIDILDPREPNSAGTHAGLAEEAVRDIRSRGKLPILAGGTGLYFRAYFQGLIDTDIPKEKLRGIRAGLDTRETGDLYRQLARCDPLRARALSPNDRQRIMRSLEIFLHTGIPHSDFITRHERREPWSGVKIVLVLPREELRRRIAARTKAMYERGWVDEVRRLLDAGVPKDAPGMNSLGYNVIAEAIATGADAQATRPAVITLTHQYAKRQDTFFKNEKGAHRVEAARSGHPSEVESLVKARFSL